MNLRFLRGFDEDLKDSSYSNGDFLFTRDTGILYLCINNELEPLNLARTFKEEGLSVANIYNNLNFKEKKERA